MSHSRLRLISIASLLIILIGGLFYSLADNTPDSKISDNYNQQSQENKGFFVDSKNDSRLESPDFDLIQENSLLAACPPITVTAQVLGSLGGGTAPQSRTEIIEYVVESGDTLSSIAEKFDISLNTVLWANDLSKKSIISVGKKLVILPVSGALHLVRQGDTLSEIAETYKGDIEEIASFNDLSEKKDIFIGDLLVIPGGKMPASPIYYANVPLSDSYFIFPTQGIVTQGLHWYNAIDVANKCGTPILAAAGGEVQRVGYNTWPAGNYVQILHPNGIVTFYGHLSKILVEAGEKVSQGRTIGYMGRTGLTTGCHLHFDVRNATNPLAKYPLGSKISWE